jgi:chloramphenicol 3-O-phosphotransferase
MFLHLEMDLVFEAMEIAGYNGAVRLGQVIPPKLVQGAAFVHDEAKFVRIDYGDDGRRAFRGFFGMVAGLAGEGNNAIIDTFLVEPWLVSSAAARLGDFPAYLVGLRCPVDELERRERERRSISGNRASVRRDGSPVRALLRCRNRHRLQFNRAVRLRDSLADLARWTRGTQSAASRRRPGHP